MMDVEGLENRNWIPWLASIMRTTTTASPLSTRTAPLQAEIINTLVAWLAFFKNVFKRSSIGGDPSFLLKFRLFALNLSVYNLFRIWIFELCVVRFQLIRADVIGNALTMFITHVTIFFPCQRTCCRSCVPMPPSQFPPSATMGGHYEHHLPSWLLFFDPVLCLVLLRPDRNTFIPSLYYLVLCTVVVHIPITSSR